MRNRAGTIALIVAPIIGLAAMLVLPNLDGDGVTRLAAIEAESTRFLVGNLLLLASFAAFVPAMLALRAPLLAQGSRWGAWAVVAAGAGWTLHLAIVGMVMSQLPMALAADRSVAAGLSESLFESDGFTVVLLPMLLLTELGTVLAAIALWRTRLVPVWASVAVVAALVSEFTVPAPFDGVALYALLTVGFALVGWQMLHPVDFERTPDEEPPILSKRDGSSGRQNLREGIIYRHRTGIPQRSRPPDRHNPAQNAGRLPLDRLPGGLVLPGVAVVVDVGQA